MIAAFVIVSTLAALSTDNRKEAGRNVQMNLMNLPDGEAEF